ncbi:MAG TPA: STAS domain-containing protein [Terriglobales bacterium]|nr:STAS domain-containing protein [Terriglobales bacterium]
METTIGVFSSRQGAEEAVRELLENKVPESEIVFLTRSEAEAKVIGKELGATVGGFVGFAGGMSAGVAAATLLIPGVGPVFALGFGAAALLGLAGAGAGAAIGKVAAPDEGLHPTPVEKCSEDAAFFREVLKEGRSLIVVRTESGDTARLACSILDRRGLGIQGRTPVKMQIATRDVADVAIVDVSGRITVGEGNVMLRDTVRSLLDNGQRKILLNLHEVGYVDSAGLGELVRTHSTVRNQGGEMKLVSISKRLGDLLQMTRLTAVFDIQADEASAIQSFSGPNAAEAVA